MDDQPILILLVDDNEDQALIATDALSEDPQIIVTVARSGHECLSRLRDAAYDLVILDYSMPRMTGMDVLRQMRTDGLTVPVIMVTGYGDEKVAVEAMQLGASDYLIKSGHYHDLLPAIVHRTIDTQQHRRELEEQRTRNIRLSAILETAVTVNHEINNPLVTVVGYAEMLAQQAKEKDAFLYDGLIRILDASRRIEGVARRLGQVINPATKPYIGDVRMLDLDAAITQNDHAADEATDYATLYAQMVELNRLLERRVAEQEQELAALRGSQMTQMKKEDGADTQTG
ncbi:MAG: response regulator [Candidatus Latescibacteria bacterium]|nr:response regulator [Candidatus Latescibacterota bacterium]